MFKKNLLWLWCKTLLSLSYGTASSLHSKYPWKRTRWGCVYVCVCDDNDNGGPTCGRKCMCELGGCRAQECCVICVHVCRGLVLWFASSVACVYVCGHTHVECPAWSFTHVQCHVWYATCICGVSCLQAHAWCHMWHHKCGVSWVCSICGV